MSDLRTNLNLGVYKGGLYENVVGDALVKQGFTLAYYRKEDSTLEQGLLRADDKLPLAG